jgi:hypothetical protein
MRRGANRANVWNARRSCDFIEGGSAAMTEEEKKAREATCDKLIREGIDDRSDQDAADRVLLLTYAAVGIKHIVGLSKALEWYEALEKRNIGGAQTIALDFGRANAFAGGRYGTQWTWDQPSLAREIYYLRRAVSHPAFPQTQKELKCICLTNLGNRMRVAGRLVEALAYWRAVIDLEPGFGMALCNRARAFAHYAQSLEGDDLRAVFYWAAHNEASKALSSTAVYTAPHHDKPTQEHTKKLMQWIESFLDVKGMAALGDPLAYPDCSASEEERHYRRWCSLNGLFLNPLNDLGPHLVAASDSLNLPRIVVPFDSPHRLESFYGQMKQEYASARWSLYEGMTSKAPHFSDRDVALLATDPRPSLSLATEKVKTAYRAAYSIFDKIAFFINDFMELGIPERQVSFRRLWRPDEKSPIRSQFDLTSNWAFCALFWLSKDLFEEHFDEVSEPQARGLNNIRNHLEHKYLRVTAGGSAPAPPDDLAYMVSRQDLESKALHLLKLSRSALVYLAIGCKFEEERRKPRYAGLPIEELPIVPNLTDDEKR